MLAASCLYLLSDNGDISDGFIISGTEHSHKGNHWTSSSELVCFRFCVKMWTHVKHEPNLTG